MMAFEIDFQPRIRWSSGSGLLLLLAARVGAQAPMVGGGPGGTVQLINTDAAMLEVQEARKDLNCTVTPTRPVLGFDLKFHAGYEVAIPMQELAGSENRLSRRMPSGGTPAGRLRTRRAAYHVDWLMRDRSERVCSHFWDLQANLSVRDKPVNVAVAPGMVQGSQMEPFREEPPVQRAQGEPRLNVKILMNFAPPSSHTATLQPVDRNALMSILRGLSRQPRIGKFSTIAFNLQEQRVLWRQDNTERIDFPSLGEALGALQLGTVDIQRLSQKHGETEFLADLIHREVAETKDADTVVFAGPKALLEQNVGEESLRQVGEVDSPVFYMNYNPEPQKMPWLHVIGHVVKFYKRIEYTISRPRDLWFVTTEMVSRIVKSTQVKREMATPTR